MIVLPVSLGEAIDKLTILDIKQNKIHDHRKQDAVTEFTLLSEKLKEYKMNEKFINELKEISDKPSSIMFHYKYYNNSIGIYLMENTIDSLKFFTEKYNFKNLALDESCKNLLFDLVVNYDLNQGKINGVGFSDYF
jgi:hypothetical protein